MIKEVDKTLYRYDLRQPPEDWNTNFLSCEYFYKEFGYKNKAGLFFFTDSIEIAKELGKSVAKKYLKSKYFLTTTRTNSLNVIDFSHCCNIYQMLCLLKDLGIDVLTKKFRTYEEHNTFDQLKDYFDNAKKEKDSSKKLGFIEKIVMHSKTTFENVGLFGQRLTDFDNGLHFKSLVKENAPKIDGYLWREFGDKRGFTYCLFDSSRLRDKVTEVIEI